MAGVVPKVFSESKQEKPDPVQSEIPFVKIPDVRIKMSHRDSFFCWCVQLGSGRNFVVRCPRKFMVIVLRCYLFCIQGSPGSIQIIVWRQPPHSSGHQGTDRLSLLSGRSPAYITGAKRDFGVLISRGDLVLIPEEMKKVALQTRRRGKAQHCLKWILTVFLFLFFEKLGRTAALPLRCENCLMTQCRIIYPARLTNFLKSTKDKRAQEKREMYHVPMPDFLE